MEIPVYIRREKMKMYDIKRNKNMNVHSNYFLGSHINNAFSDNNFIVLCSTVEIKVWNDMRVSA